MPTQVVEVRHKATGRVHALKAVDKHLVLRHKQANYIRAERALLDRLAHPGIVRLRFTFQDAASLYLGLDLCPNGSRRARVPGQAGRQGFPCSGRPSQRRSNCVLRESALVIGELYDQIQRKGQLALEEARFYASEIVDILAYLREQQVRPRPATLTFVSSWSPV